MVSRHFVQVFGAVAAGLLLASCATDRASQDLLAGKLDQTATPAPMPQSKRDRFNTFLLANGGATQDSSFAGYSQTGTDSLTGPPRPVDTSRFDNDTDAAQVNLLGVTIAQAAKSVLGDVLAVSYTLDNRVTGAITLQTPKPVSKSRLLQLFEASLRDNGAAIIAQGETWRIVPIADSVRATTPLAAGSADMATAGVHPRIVTLRYVSAADMRDVLEPMIPQGMILRADEQRNALILSGTDSEIAAIRETISVFDVDWMRGMSFALVPIKTSSPVAVAQDLEQIFNTRSGALKGILRFVPNNRLKSVLVITSRAKYLREATKWIRKIDAVAQSGQQSLHVYHVQNRSAADLSKVLQSVLEANGAGQPAGNGMLAQASVAPRYATATVGNVPQAGGNTADAGNGASGAMVTGGPETPANGPDSLSPGPNPYGMGQDTASQPPPIRVVADDANNSLLIYCTDADYQRIKPILFEIDAVPNQVLLEAVIAEVSLDDELKFGVRWFLGGENNNGTFSDATSGAVAPVFPGFSYFLKANNIGLSLNALSSVTNVKVLSAPSLVVLDNKTATLQVGDQVPIVTQQAQSVTGGGTPIINTVEMKDTGVILHVTPRVNDTGLVTLDIEQEVSNVTKTTTSGIDSPTIQQRKMQTSIVVHDSEALALGGLIQERQETGKSKVPVLGDVPVLGAAFRQKSDAVRRTELIIFIRPRVIRDLAEARQVTEEFRNQLSIQAPNIRRSDPTPGSELMRIVN